MYHVPLFYNKLHLVDALFARTPTSFGVGQTVYFSFINTNVSIKQILLTCVILFYVSSKHRNLVKGFKFSTYCKWSIYANVKHKTCTIQEHLTWMNHCH